MEKTYERINWKNYPSVVTPINEKNLNKMDSALDEVDNRVIGLDTAKLDKSIANTMIKDLDVDETTGIFTITYLNGTVKKVDTGLEKIATNFAYKRDTQKLVLTLTDGTEQEVDLSSLISQYEFTDSDFIAFTVDADGKVSATIKSGSITEDMLQPNFLADVKVEVEKAKKSSDSASAYAEQSKQYRDEAEQIKKEIESVTDVEIATTEKAGIVKPDGETITVDENGKISVKKQSGGASSWADLENKPFDSVENGLVVKDEVLQVDMLKTMEEVEANEDENKLASALVMKEVIEEVHKGLESTMRYNDKTDMIQVKIDDSWVNWKKAGLFDVYLFNNGDISDVTGGWDFVNRDTATKGVVSVGSTLGVYITDNNAGEVKQHSPSTITNEKINVDDFTKAIITVSSYKNSSGSSGSNFSVYALTEKELSSNYTASSKTYSQQSATSNFTIELDLSNVSGYVYFAISTYYASVYISKIQLV